MSARGLHFSSHRLRNDALRSSAENGTEHVVVSQVDYVDNVPCIDLVSSLRGGLLAALDAECAARGSPELYVARIKAAHRCPSNVKVSTELSR